MKIDFEHLGGIDKGSVELNDLTVFCGKNNSGKTYVMYSLYGLLDNRFKISFDFVKPIVDKLKQEGTYCLDIAKVVAEHQDEMILQIEESFKEYLPNLFGVTENEFLNTKIRLYFSDKEIQGRIKDGATFSHSGVETENFWTISLEADDGKIQLTLNNVEVKDVVLQTYISEKLIDIIFLDWSPIFKDSFLLPAERAGINLFFKELFSIRNLLLQQAQNDNVDPIRLLRDIVKSRYAEPVKDYTQFLNNISNIQRDKHHNRRYRKYALELEKNVLGGKYEVDEFGNVFFLPADRKDKLPLQFSSSSVKTLFGLVFYLEHLAKTNDYLMIDEPELNLHPDNQRQVARVLAQLVNAGLKVIVSTHSDYFVRELNNLIMLKNEFSGAKELQNKYGYQDNELLASKQVSAYLFDDKKISPMVLNEEGIVAETFNDVINKLNQSSNEIYYAMQDAKELESW